MLQTQCYGSQVSRSKITDKQTVCGQNNNPSINLGHLCIMAKTLLTIKGPSDDVIQSIFEQP